MSAKHSLVIKINLEALRFQIVAILCVALISCTHGDVNNGGALFPKVEFENIVNNKTKLTDIFVDYKIVPLETTSESLIGGRSTKIIKRKGIYYVKSINNILVFKNDGKFLGKLSNIGFGPGEYDQIIDFDISNRYEEIWISATKGIYKYDLNSFDYSGLISFSYPVTQFKILDDNTIIIRAIDNEMFKICSIKGETIQSYYQHDKANSSYAPVGFVNSGNLIVYHLESSNNVISYDLETKRFELRNIISSEKDLETCEINRAYYARYGYLEQVEMVQEKFVGITAFRNLGDTILMTVRYPNGSKMINITVHDNSRSFIYDPPNNCNLINDIVENGNPLFYNTLICGESDDSFLFKCDLESEDVVNPVIIDIKRIKL